MKSKLIVFTLLLATLTFSGCSYLETFILKNNTNTEVKVIYTLDSLTKNYGIFMDQPTGYKLNSTQKVNYDENLNLTDQNFSKYEIEVTLPPQSALDIGTLSNDNYISASENESDFNLIQMTILFEDFSFKITPKNFDQYFISRDNGVFGCEISTIKKESHLSKESAYSYNYSSKTDQP